MVQSSYRWIGAAHQQTKFVKLSATPKKKKKKKENLIYTKKIVIMPQKSDKNSAQFWIIWNYEEDGKLHSTIF